MIMNRMTDAVLEDQLMDENKRRKDTLMNTNRSCICLFLIALAFTGCTTAITHEMKDSAVKQTALWDKPGYVTIEDEGRLWVFEADSEDLAKFKEHGEPAKMVVLPGRGPNRMTLKGTDRDVMMEYMLTKPGYKVFLDDGRLWVFEAGSEDLAKFEEHGEPAKMVVLPGRGPNRMTLKGTDRDVMMKYMLTKPGYKVFLDEGRLWVFEAGSEDLAKFEEHGEPAKMVVLPGRGPNGMTLKGTDRDVMMEYMLTKPGYKVFLDEGRLWVFEAGSEDLAKFKEHGEPAKIVVRPGAGPNGMTLKSVDGAILDAYMAR